MAGMRQQVEREALMLARRRRNQQPGAGPARFTRLNPKFTPLNPRRRIGIPTPVQPGKRPLGPKGSTPRPGVVRNRMVTRAPRRQM